MSAKLSSKGQITVPLAIRNRLGVEEGDRVEFVVQGDAVVIRPVRVVESPFAAYAGVLRTFPGGPREIRNWIGDLRDSD